MKIKLFFTTVLVALFGGTAIGQTGFSCSRVKGHSHLDQRSARLSNHDIGLTQKYDVHFYKLDIELERTSTAIAGVVEIHATASATVLDTFLFELWDDFTIDEIRLNGITPLAYSRVESAVYVPVDFEMGDAFFIEISYSGLPPEGGGPLGGGGMTNDFSPTWGNQVTWSLSEPFAAYEWFPCKQLLTDKADSSYVFVTTDASNKAGSNGLLTAVVDVPGGKKRYEWKSNYPIDYYLISVAVADYVEYNIYAEPLDADPILIQNFIYDSPGCLTFFTSDINETADFLEHYSTLFGLYPFHNEKYGHCMAPLGGGMEHQTMTTQGYFNNTLTAHELAHQWFGDQVTCASWSDIWLNEGFASYSEEIMLAEFYPGGEVSSMLARHDDIMSEPGGAVWVEDSLSVGRIFSGRLTYDKGAAIVHTLRFLMNDDDVFYDVLQTYQDTYAMGTAHAADFKQVAETVSGLDFTNYFNEWYYGEGFPTYSIEYALVDGELVVVLNQDVSMPGITPFFTNDLEIRITGVDGYTETVRLTGIDAASTVHSFPFPEAVDGIQCDPKNWIINQYTGATENLALASIAEFNEVLNIYPNPAVNELVFDNQINATAYQVLDVNGKIVMQGNLSNGVNSLNVSSLSVGQYVFKVNENQKTFSKL